MCFLIIEYYRLGFKLSFGIYWLFVLKQVIYPPKIKHEDNVRYTVSAQ